MAGVEDATITRHEEGAWPKIERHTRGADLKKKVCATLRVMESIKVGSTLRINAGRGESGLLWQPRFFDRALRTVKEYHEKVEYIHQNPVKAGLVRRAEDWPWSSVQEYTGTVREATTRHPILAIDRVRLPADERVRI